jgi:hypothetical protein
MPYYKQLIHLDSYNNRVTDEYYNCKFTLDKPYRKVKKVSLLSLEMPIGFCNIHEGINEFKICIQGIFYSFYIPVGTYASAFDVATAIGLAIPSDYVIGQTSPFHGGFNVGLFTLSYSDVFEVWCSSYSGGNNNSADWYVCDTPLSNLILGIYSTEPKYIFNSHVKNSQKSCINIDNYVSMHIAEIGTNSYDNRISYKIPTPLSMYSVLYLTDHIFYPQSVYCDIESLNTLSIKFYDRFGNDLVSNGYTWSGTLELICEI